MSWNLEKPARKPGRAGIAFDRIERQSVILVRNVTVAGLSGPIKIEAVDGFNHGAKGDRLIVPIPRDFYLMLCETDVAEPEVRRIPVDWRLATRAAFQMLFRKGYRVADFIPAAGPAERNYYILNIKKTTRPSARSRRPS